MASVKWYLGAVGILTAVGLWAGLNPGGVSVDLRQIDAAQNKAAAGVNLVPDSDFENPQLDLKQRRQTWYGGVWVWKRGTRDAAHRKSFFLLPQQNIDAHSGVNNSRCVKLSTPLAVQKLRNAKGEPMLYSAVAQMIAVPDSATPVKYELTFMLKGQNFTAPGFNRMHYFVRFEDKAPYQRGAKSLRKEINKSVNLTGKYVKQTLNFIAPAHTRRLTLMFRLYGLGEAYLDNVELRPVALTREVKAYVLPFSWLDNTFCLGEQQPGALTFVLQNEAQLPCRNLKLHLRVPSGFKVWSGNSNTAQMTSAPGADGTTEVQFDIQKVASNIPHDGYTMWRKPTVIISSSRRAGAERFPLIYYLSNNGQKGTPQTLNLQVIPSVQGARPQNFVTGFQCTHEFNVEGEAAQKIAQWLQYCGFNALHDGRSKTLRQMLQRANFFLASSQFYINNGYRIGGPKNRTPESLFRLVTGEKFVNRTVNTCPVEVYRRGKFYRSEVLPLIEKTVGKTATSQHLMSNWEPYYFDFKGCFCDRCREEFVNFMAGKVEATSIRAAWPREIITKYEKDWIKFRGQQHGKVCQTLEEDVHRIGKLAGKNSHFIPEIAWSQLIEASYPDFAQYSPVYYLDKLPIIEPWGPYIFSDFTKNYEYFTGIHLITYFAAQSIPQFVAKRVANPAQRPQLLAFPHGVQCGSWITEPEALSFEYLCFFLNQWHGALAYFFPQGYDQRYFNALAATNKIIAQHENVVLKGQNISLQVKVTPRTPLPPAAFPNYWNEGGNFKQKLPQLGGASVLQCVAYARGTERVVALGNFWQRGELFAQVQIKGLAPQKTYYVASSDGYTLGRFSGRDLAQGLLVHVGALRWNLLRITPRASAGPLIDQQAMNKLYQAKLPAIKQAYQHELTYQQKVQGEAARENPVNDFKSIYELHQKQVSLKAVQVNSRDYLELKSPDYRVLLDPAKGGSIVAAQLHGVETVNPDEPHGWGSAAIWSPKRLAHNINGGFKISGMAKTSDGIAVELTRVITRKEKLALAGVKVVKTWHFSPHKITLTTTLTNGRKIAVRVAFRYSNMPRHLQGMTGQAQFDLGVKFIRDRVTKMVRCSAPDPAIDRVFKIVKFVDSLQANFTLTAPQLPTLNLAFPGTQPHGIVFWDTKHGATLEPVFPMQKIMPKQSVQYALSWEW